MALTTPPNSLIQNQDDGVLDASITASATSLTISPIKKWVNGVLTTGGFDSSKAFCKIIDSTGRYEFISFDTKTVSAANITTLSGIRRGLSVSVAGYAAGTGMAFDANTRIYVCDYAQMWHNTSTLLSSLQSSSSRITSGTYVTFDQNFTLSANSLQTGDICRLTYCIDSVNDSTGSFRARFGGTALTEYTGQQSASTSAGNFYRFTGTVRSSTTIQYFTECFFISTGYAFNVNSGGLLTTDLTMSNVIDMQALKSAGGGSGFALNQLIVEIYHI